MTDPMQAATAAWYAVKNDTRSPSPTADPLPYIQAIVRAVLAAKDAEIAGLRAWRETVIDGLVVAHIYQAKHDAEPKQALHDLICWEVMVALDPRVSSDAEALIQRGRDQAAPANEGVEVG